MRKGFFTYPWDLLDEGLQAGLGRMQHELNCNAIVLNACYHHARLLRPRSTGPKTLELPGAAAAFRPQPAYYPDPALTPVPYERLVEADVLGSARRICSDQGLACVLWVVGLHNSTLGEKAPQWCMQNCFGDIYPYALCPSAPEVQAYIQALIGDICDQFSPDRVLLEAIGFLSLPHWVHHELFFSEWNEVLEFLFSLCFCPNCQDQARQAGIDPLKLRRDVGATVQAYLNEERTGPTIEQTLGEIPSMLLAMPGLAGYLQNRSRAVGLLVAGAAQSAHERDVRLDAIPASFHRPSSRAWIEGADLRQLARASDGLVTLPYYGDPGPVAADIQWVRQQTGAAPLSVGLSALPPAVKDEAGLLAVAQAAAAGSPEAVYFYNYGLMNARRLGWVGQAFATI